jgi:3-oxoacyl-[acyl-carrier protein] reductase
MKEAAKRRALVTGGSRGIGLAIARALAADGLEVVVTYGHDVAGAEAAVVAARAEGLALSAVQADAGDVAAWDALFARDGALGLAERGAQVLVHAAGFTRDGLLMTQAPADFDAVLAVHLRGAYLAARAALRGMIAGRFGRILFLSSPTAVLGRRGQCSYGAAKAGLMGLVRSLVAEVSRFQITVNCVSAGLIDTALTAELPEAVRQSLLSAVPMGRSGQVDEVAALVRFLASESAGYITGQHLAADGGLDTLAGDAF